MKRGRTSAQGASPPHKLQRKTTRRANQFGLSETMSSPARKNILLFRRPESGLLIRPSHPTRGVAHVTNARWDAMDATASGAQGIAGRIELRERSAGVRTNGAANCLRRNWPDGYEVRRELWRDGRGRRNRVVLAPRCWRQVLWRCVRPTGLAMYRQSARRRWQKCKAHRGGHV
jgi:hypothetical protein